MLLAPIVLLTPFILVYLTGKSKKAFKGVGLITLISGLSFLLPEYFVAKYLGAELPVVIGSVCSMFATVVAAKLLGNKNVEKEYLLEENKKEKVSLKDAITAWSPFILIFICLVGTSKIVAPINTVLSSVKSVVNLYNGEGATPYTFSWLATPGFWIILSGFIGGFIQGASFKDMLVIFKKTLIQMVKTIITIIAIMATAKLMGYSGMIASISLMFVTVTGSFYPFFAPMLGSIGTFVTGSGTSASVLFGGLQAETSQALNLNQALIAASNTAGAITAKMISPQNIAVAVAAVNLPGKESELFKGTVKYYILFLAIVGVFTYIASLYLG